MSLRGQDCRVGVEATASPSREVGMWKDHTGLTLSGAKGSPVQLRWRDNHVCLDRGSYSLPLTPWSFM